MRGIVDKMRLIINDLKWNMFKRSVIKHIKKG